jgi:DNA-directed RNA polymerase sigma subunit (sigma70/sigma32)
MVIQRPTDREGLTTEEVAAALSLDEGRPVTILENRKIECQALRKIRSALARRGLRADDLFEPDA